MNFTEFPRVHAIVNTKEAEALVRLVRLLLDGGQRGIGDASLGVANVLFFTLTLGGFVPLDGREIEETMLDRQGPEQRLHGPLALHRRRLDGPFQQSARDLLLQCGPPREPGLAAYGWNAFLVGGRTSAAGLGWPLHAIGDACEPHHVVGTSAQGHRPFEDSVNNDRKILLDTTNTAQLERVLGGSFDWYNAFVSSNLNIQDFITRIASSTRSIVASLNDRVYQDGLSTQYLSEPESATLNYAGYTEEKTALLEQASSAALAFLVIASIDAVDPGRGDIKCPAGTNETVGFSPGDRGVNYQCDPGGPCPPGMVQDPTALFCEAPGQGQDAGLIFLASPASVGADGSSGGCVTPCATNADCASISATAQCLSGCCIEQPH